WSESGAARGADCASSDFLNNPERHHLRRRAQIFPARNARQESVQRATIKRSPLPRANPVAVVAPPARPARVRLGKFPAASGGSSARFPTVARSDRLDTPTLG